MILESGARASAYSNDFTTHEHWEMLADDPIVLSKKSPCLLALQVKPGCVVFINTGCHSSFRQIPVSERGVAEPLSPAQLPYHSAQHPDLLGQLP
ncbi:hypothetical protein [Acetobacter aceti]|uniref:hypothetical protein n=1 Tax=Acetobacter aceti TaxID=435 RepID=UPI0014056007|nr:hypothetical protein [Acetobacter aceti]